MARAKKQVEVQAPVLVEAPVVEAQEVTLKVGHIASGKAFIVSFYDKKGGKMIQVSPFQVKPANEYYAYGHHFDMRSDKDQAKLVQRFKSLLSIEQLRSTEKFKGITEVSYTQWVMYSFYELIKSGQMSIQAKNASGVEVKLKVEWSGADMEPPVIKQASEKKPKEKVAKADMLEGLSF